MSVEMLAEPVSKYASPHIASVDPKDTIQSLIEAMSRMRVRHVMVSGSTGFLTVDSLFRLIHRVATVAEDPRHIGTMRVGALKTVKPPRVSGFISLLEAARVMATSSLDFLLVDSNRELKVFSVRELLAAVEPGDVEDPAIRYSMPRYPSVGPGDRIIDVIGRMSVHGVRSILVVEGRSIMGVIPSLSIVDALSHLGLHALWDEVDSVMHPVEAVVASSATVSEAAISMAKYGSEAVMLKAGKEVVGVLDEWGVIQAIAGSREGLVLG